MCTRRILLILLLLLFPTIGLGQKMVQDTLFIPIIPAPLPDSCHFQIKQILDQRGLPEKELGRMETKAYVFVPIDLVLATHTRLSEALFAPGAADSVKSVKLQLALSELRLALQQQSQFFPHYQINSATKIYVRPDEGDSVFLGQLFHEITFKKSFWNDKLSRGLEITIQRWQRQMLSDLEQIALLLQARQPVNLENFRTSGQFISPVNLITGTDFILTTDGYLVDGDIIFSGREAQHKFHRNGYNLRFRHSDVFESIEFGLSIDYWFWRTSPKVLFNLKSQLMFGFNRWNDFESTKHKIWDAMILDYSLSQKFNFNPLDSKSLIFGVGIFEDVFYVYSKNIKFQPGILIYAGVKL